MYDLVKALHLLAAVVWVGGMFFAWVIARPALASLDGPERLALWDRLLNRFLHPWVIGSVIILPLTGYLMMLVWLGGFAYSYTYVHVMHGLGLLMIGLFLWMYCLPWRQFHRLVANAQWPEAAAALTRIRRVVGTNLILGLITIVVAAAGRSWLPA